MDPRLLPRAGSATLPGGGDATRRVPVGRSRTVTGAAGRLDACLGRLRRGGGDPTHRRVGTTWWRAANTPAGPVLLRLADAGDDVEVSAWGEGADWALDQAPRLLGGHDEADFHPAHEGLRLLVHRFPRLRVGATDLVCESLLPSVVEQKVTGAEAFAAITRLTRLFSAPAPGPAQVPGHAAWGMCLPLTAAQWAAIPSWDYLRAGVEQKRSATLVGAARRGRAVERTLGRPDAGTALTSLPGIGPWTAARALQQAHGDPDAWSTGDYHVPGQLSLFLCGEALDDAGCAEVLEPYAGHRYRVEMLVLAAGFRPERHGARRSLPTHLPG